MEERGKNAKKGAGFSIEPLKSSLAGQVAISAKTASVQLNSPQNEGSRIRNGTGFFHQ
jgi:hypothetical protein